MPPRPCLPPSLAKIHAYEDTQNPPATTVCGVKLSGATGVPAGGGGPAGGVPVPVPSSGDTSEPGDDPDPVPVDAPDPVPVDDPDPVPGSDAGPAGAPAAGTTLRPAAAAVVRPRLQGLPVCDDCNTVYVTWVHQQAPVGAPRTLRDAAQQRGVRVFQL